MVASTSLDCDPRSTGIDEIIFLAIGCVSEVSVLRKGVLNDYQISLGMNVKCTAKGQ